MVGRAWWGVVVLVIVVGFGFVVAWFKLEKWSDERSTGSAKVDDGTLIALTEAPTALLTVNDSAVEVKVVDVSVIEPSTTDSASSTVVSSGTTATSTAPEVRRDKLRPRPRPVFSRTSLRPNPLPNKFQKSLRLRPGPARPPRFHASHASSLQVKSHLDQLPSNVKTMSSVWESVFPLDDSRRSLLNERRISIQRDYCKDLAYQTDVERQTDCLCEKGHTVCYKNIPVHFVIIGFPKTGTTSMLYNLGEHLNVSMTLDSIFEDHFFGKPRTHDEITAYIRQITRKAQLKKATFIGLKDPSYVNNAAAMFRISQIPNVKIVISVREFTSWLLSFYEYRRYESLNPSSWMHQNGWNVTSCPKWMRGSTVSYTKKLSGDTPQLESLVKGGCKWAGVSLESAQFAQIIAHNVLPLIAPENMLIIPMTHRIDPDTTDEWHFYNKLAKHIGLPPFATGYVFKNMNTAEAHHSKKTFNWCSAKSLLHVMQEYYALEEVMVRWLCEQFGPQMDALQFGSMPAC